MTNEERTPGQRARDRADALYGRDSDSLELLRALADAQGHPFRLRGCESCGCNHTGACDPRFGAGPR